MEAVVLRIGQLRMVVVGSTSCLRGSWCVSYQVSQPAAVIIPSQGAAAGDTPVTLITA